MDDRQPDDAEALGDLVGDLRRGPPRPSTRGPRTRARRPAGRRGAPPPPPGPAPASPASRGSARRTRRPRRRPASPAALRAPRRARSGTASARSSMTRIVGPARLRRAAADRRDAGQLVAVGQDRVRVGVLAVPGEPDRRSPGARTGNRSTSAAQAVLDRRAVGQLEGDLARPGELALDGEQADPEAHRRQPRYEATRSPSPTGRIVALKRGSRRTAVSKARRIASVVVAASCRLGRRTPRPDHRTLSATTSAPGSEPRHERLEVGQVLVLERVDEGEVERAERGPARPRRRRTPRAPAG